MAKSSACGWRRETQLLHPSEYSRKDGSPLLVRARKGGHPTSSEMSSCLPGGQRTDQSPLQEAKLWQRELAQAMTGEI